MATTLEVVAEVVLSFLLGFFVYAFTQSIFVALLFLILSAIIWYYYNKANELEEKLKQKVETAEVSG